MSWLALSTLLFAAAPQLSSIRALEDRESFTPAQAAQRVEQQPETTWLNFGWTRATIWFRFDVTGPPGPAVIDVGREWLEEVDLFALDESAT
ncbi:7TM-DISM domain-containing protein, partial [Xanthomonas citri pv. citri]